MFLTMTEQQTNTDLLPQFGNAWGDIPKLIILISLKTLIEEPMFLNAQYSSIMQEYCNCKPRFKKLNTMGILILGTLIAETYQSGIQIASVCHVIRKTIQLLFRHSENQTFLTRIQTPFEFGTILQPNRLGSFQYLTSTIFGSLLYTESISLS